MPVYVAQEPARHDRATGRWIPTLDLSNTHPFGELTFLFQASEIHAALLTQPTTQRMRRELRNFSDSDYLLLVGDSVLGSMAVAIALEANRGKAKILRWNRDNRNYDVVQLNLHRAEIEG
jgi:hypothetical protein